VAITEFEAEMFQISEHGLMGQ